MRYFYDTEFVETGLVIDLVSIGVVAEDGREYYAVSTEYDPAPATAWVRDNVLARLPGPADPAHRSRAQIRADLLELFDADPVLWAWYPAYDHVALGQLWGDMTALPRHLPRTTYDVRQLWDSLGRPPLPDQAGPLHDALADARHVKARFDALAEPAYRRGLSV